MTSDQFKARRFNGHGQQPSGPPMGLTEFLRRQLNGRMDFEPGLMAVKLTPIAKKAGYQTCQDDVRRTLWRIQHKQPVDRSTLTYPQGLKVALQAVSIPPSARIMRFVRRNLTETALTNLYAEAKRICNLVRAAGISHKASQRSISDCICRLLVLAARDHGKIPERF